MEKITMENFEKMLAGDEALTAKAKAITGTGEEKKQKVIDLAASLGYELDFSNGMQPLSDEEVNGVAGGLIYPMGIPLFAAPLIIKSSTFGRKQVVKKA